MIEETTGTKPKSFPATNLDDQLLALLRIAAAMLEASNLDEILSAITREVSRFITFDRSSVAFLTPDKQSLILRNIHEGESKHKAGEGRMVPLDERTVLGWVSINQKTSVRNNIPEDHTFEEVVYEVPLNSDIVVPLIGRNGLIGTLNIGSYHTNAFSADQIEVVEACAKFASLAIEHTTTRIEALDLGERYRTLQENANDIIMIIDRNTAKIVEGNRKCERVLGYPKEELVKRSFFDLFPEEEKYQARRDFINILSQKDQAFTDRKMMNRDGYLIYVDINASLIKLKDDLFLQVIVHNVSQRRMLEQQIIRQNQRLQAANQKLTKVDQMKTEFLANISHELRTPLSIIMAYADSLRDSDLTEEDRLNFLDVISDNGGNLLTLINNLLDLSKLEVSGQSLNMSLSHVHDVIKSIWPKMETLAKEKGLSLSFEPGSKVPISYFDNNQLGRVFQCLIQNAIKFTDSGGYVQVSTVREGNEVRIIVSDTGAGMHEGEIEDIFNTFHQVDGSASRKAGGLGIGLTLARHIVELHKGKLWAESQFGIGSTFTVSLPLDTESVFPENEANGAKEPG